MKTCRGCEVVLPFSAFFTNPNMKDGHLSWCRKCTVKRYAAGKAKRQRELLAYIQAIKVARGCVDCGYNANPVALDFDHLPGTEKKHRIATMAAGLRRELIDAEIAKCEVVCANCHRIRTNERLRNDA